jgi:hypothetical protein
MQKIGEDLEVLYKGALIENDLKLALKVKEIQLKFSKELSKKLNDERNRFLSVSEWDDEMLKIIKRQLITLTSSPSALSSTLDLCKKDL